MPDSMKEDLGSLSDRVSRSDEHQKPAVRGYVVVASMKAANIRTVPIYDFCRTLNDAADLYNDYQNGEYRDIAEVGIFPCDERGMPIDKPLDPHTLTQLVRETRAA